MAQNRGAIGFSKRVKEFMTDERHERKKHSISKLTKNAERRRNQKKENADKGKGKRTGNGNRKRHKRKKNANREKSKITRNAEKGRKKRKENVTQMTAALNLAKVQPSPIGLKFELLAPWRPLARFLPSKPPYEQACNLRAWPPFSPKIWGAWGWKSPPEL